MTGFLYFVYYSSYPYPFPLLFHTSNWKNVSTYKFFLYVYLKFRFYLTNLCFQLDTYLLLYFHHLFLIIINWYWFRFSLVRNFMNFALNHLYNIQDFLDFWCRIWFTGSSVNLVYFSGLGNENKVFYSACIGSWIWLLVVFFLCLSLHLNLWRLCNYLLGVVLFLGGYCFLVIYLLIFWDFNLRCQYV